MKKLNINFIRNEFEKEEYKLLTITYINCKQKLDYVCPNGHKHSTSWDNWKQRYRCPYCDGQSKPAIEFIRSEFEKENYRLLTTKYINNRQKLYYICPKRHQHNITWSSWQQGHRCPYCAGNGKPTIEFIRLEFKKENYQLLTNQYKNCDQKLEYICSNGHRHDISWNAWRQGRRCSYCIITASKGEIEVRKFVESLGVKILSNDRSQIFNFDTNRKFELDIFMPDFNKAIEYNGNYWHKNRKEDLIKQQLCELKNINLLIIWENDWKMKNNICRNKIKKFLFNTSNFDYDISKNPI